MNFPLFALLLPALLVACAAPGPPPHHSGRPLQTRDNVADLQGPTADDVIWQATHQWHADRRRDAFQRRY